MPSPRSSPVEHLAEHFVELHRAPSQAPSSALPSPANHRVEHLTEHLVKPYRSSSSTLSSPWLSPAKHLVEPHRALGQASPSTGLSTWPSPWLSTCLAQSRSEHHPTPIGIIRTMPNKPTATCHSLYIRVTSEFWVKSGYYSDPDNAL